MAANQQFLTRQDNSEGDATPAQQAEEAHQEIAPNNS
jgi:hypothetical protein